MRAASVRSADGTAIGYRVIGSGPGLIVLHGGMQASQSLTRLAEALGRDFTVYLPDRRGRGMSGTTGAAFGIEAECQDIAALAAQTNAERMFGLSAGGIVALWTARRVPAIRKLALYEPPFSINGSTPVSWVARCERELAANDLASAFVTAVKGLRTTRMALVPRPLLRAFAVLALRLVKPADGEIPIRDLIPTILRDMRVIHDTRDGLAGVRDLEAQVLLMAGSRSPDYLHVALNALQSALPQARRVLFQGLDHQAPDNDGDPVRIAAALRDFLA